MNSLTRVLYDYAPGADGHWESHDTITAVALAVAAVRVLMFARAVLRRRGAHNN